MARAALPRLAALLAPSLASLDRAFAAHLRHARTTPGFDALRLRAIAAVTPGAAFRLLASGRTLAEFFEQAGYHGRRLARLNVSPVVIIDAVRRYERLLRALPAAKPFRPACDQLRLALALTVNGAFYQVRQQEAEAFYRLSRAESQSRGFPELVGRFLEILRETFRARAARFYLLDRQPPPPALLRRLARPRYIASGSASEALILDAALRGRFACYWSVPWFAHGKPAGLVQLAFASPYRWLPRELGLLEAIAERAAAAAERARLLEDLAARRRQVRRLAARMLQVEEEERRRISRELHDEAGQSLLLLRLELELAERGAPPELRLRLAEARRVVERTVAEIRRIIAALSPAVLDHLGLPAALRQLAVRLRRVCPARIRLRLCTPEPRLPREVETVAYRLAQECLHNAARHAAARNINLSLRCSDSYVEVAVRDDGVGFDVAAAHAGAQGWGLPGMRQRVALLGGTLQLRSHPGDGTTVRARLPLAALRHQAAYADSSHPAHR